MRIFEQQQAARRESLRLLLLFALAVTATLAGVHLALAALFWTADRVLPFAFTNPIFVDADEDGVFRAPEAPQR